MTAPTPLVHDFAGAAERLAPVVSEAWLRKHFRDLPHRKFGASRNGRVGFTDADIAAILDRFAVNAVGAPAPTPDARITRRRAS